MSANHLKFITIISALIFGALLSGCAGPRPAVKPTVQPTAVQAHPLSAHDAGQQDRSGSLWRAGGPLNDLFMDTKARNVGDVVTVKIEESAEATNSADTKTGRSSSLQAGIDKLFSLEDWYQDHVLDYSDSLPKFNPFGKTSVQGSMQSDFNGTGTTSRSGDLKAFITCRVAQVLPNGNLQIVGSREVMVNNENQLIILTGVIRPRDISDNNVILSTYVSNAKIAYSGTGVIDDRQRPGWLANLLNAVWPF